MFEFILDRPVPDTLIEKVTTFVHVGQKIEIAKNYKFEDPSLKK